MPDAQRLLPGDPRELGPYKILGRLGKGGQGDVFLGRAPHSDQVAIKLLHGRLSDDPAARGRFVRELDVAKQVARFCTAQVLDADVAGDRPYIVSEYVEGHTLHKLVETEGPRTEGALERLAIGTLTALTAIHQAGIVHRDFKPHNVMLGPDGPRVIDFGVARALDAAGDTENIGTPSYMAPEQFTSGGIGPGTDMFAWGATMVYAAVGRPPFGNDEVAAVMARILHGEPDIGPLPSPLSEVVTACLAKDPAQRPTARDAQQRLLGSQATSGSPAGPAEASAAPPGQAIPPVGLAEQPAAAPPPTEQSAASPQQTTAPEPPREPKGLPRRLLPLAAAAVVGGLLLGGPLWVASGDDEPDRNGNRQAPPGAGSSQTAAPSTGPSGDSATSGTQRQHGAAAGKRAGQAPPAGQAGGGSQPQPSNSSGTGGSGGSGGGGETNKRNPYAATQVCNSGGHGGGYYVQRSSSFNNGRTYQLYNSSGYNCVVTLKTANVGEKTRVWAQLKRQSDGKSARDDGSYAYYAGPVFLSAKGTCVAYSGGTNSGSTSASWANCG
jgi:predicted Ser/Thr protein kinase